MADGACHAVWEVYAGINPRKPVYLNEKNSPRLLVNAAQGKRPHPLTKQCSARLCLLFSASHPAPFVYHSGESGKHSLADSISIVYRPFFSIQQQTGPSPASQPAPHEITRATLRQWPATRGHSEPIVRQLRRILRRLGGGLPFSSGNLALVRLPLGYCGL